MEYSDYEIKRLHWELYDILDEIQRVCDILHIKCFIQGGSAIGAFFEQAILPCDDDIDVGMLRDDYERFLREAPQLLGPKYFLQWVGSEKHMPHVLAKVRKNGTEFREYYYRNVLMHQGIYVDIMPYDKVPDTVWLQSLQRGVLRFSPFVSSIRRCGDGSTLKQVWWMNLLLTDFSRVWVFLFVHRCCQRRLSTNYSRLSAAYLTDGTHCITVRLKSIATILA